MNKQSQRVVREATEESAFDRWLREEMKSVPIEADRANTESLRENPFVLRTDISGVFQHIVSNLEAIATLQAETRALHGSLQSLLRQLIGGKPGIKLLR
jgi:hypothetical protein